LVPEYRVQSRNTAFQSSKQRVKPRNNGSGSPIQPREVICREISAVEREFRRTIEDRLSQCS
jgi:hypothetical protein